MGLSPCGIRVSSKASERARNGRGFCFRAFSKNCNHSEAADLLVLASYSLSYRPLWAYSFAQPRQNTKISRCRAAAFFFKRSSLDGCFVREFLHFGSISARFCGMRSIFSRSFFAVRLILNVFVGCVLYVIAIPSCYVPQGMDGTQHFNWLGLGTPSLFFLLCTFALWVRR